MRHAVVLLAAVTVMGCHHEAATTEAGQPWDVATSRDVGGSDVATEPEPGLPQHYVNHPHSARHALEGIPDGSACPEEYPPGSRGAARTGPPSATRPRPTRFSGVIWAFDLDANTPRQVAPWNHDLYVRFQNRDERWHRFEVRSNDGRTGWSDVWQEGLDLRAQPDITFGLILPDCAVPTQEQVDAFWHDFGVLEIIYHDVESGASFHFGPRRPHQATSSASIGAPGYWNEAWFAWEFPVNREFQGPPYIEPVFDEGYESRDTSEDPGFRVITP